MLGHMGYRRDTSPNLDAFAKQGASRISRTLSWPYPECAIFQTLSTADRVEYLIARAATVNCLMIPWSVFPVRAPRHRGHRRLLILLPLLPLVHLLMVLLLEALNANERIVGTASWVFFSILFLTEGYVVSCVVIDRVSIPFRVLLTSVLTAAEIVIILQLALSIHILEDVTFLAALDAFLVIQGGLLVTWARPLVTEHEEDHSASILWGLALIALIPFLFHHSPPTDNDALTYHLRYPVEWMQQRNLDTPFEAFGDFAPTFYPILSGLLYLWNLVFMESDFWARGTQLPFLIVIAAATVAIVKNLGGGQAATVLSIVFLATVPILRHAYRDQGNDVIVAAFLLAAVAFLLELRDSAQPWAAFGFALASALSLGTKYLAVVAVPVLLGLSLLPGNRFWIGRGRRQYFLYGGVFGVLVLALSSYSYLRNVVATGSLIFPASIEGVPGLTAAVANPNLYSHEFREITWSLSSLNSALGIGCTLIAVLAVVSLVLEVLEQREESARKKALLLTMSVVATLLFYALIPYRHERFLLFPFLALVPLAATVLKRTWISERIASNLSKTLTARRRYLQIGVGIVFVGLASQMKTYEREKYERWSSQSVAGMYYGGGWHFLNERASSSDRPLRIAMSKTQNIPYPLYGPRFRNKVAYVPETGRPDDLYYRWSSAELFPFDRMKRRAWRDFMLVFQADYFFSTTVMQEESFGREDEWARRRPNLFRLVYEDPQVRIYEVENGGSPRPTREQQ